MIAILLSQKNMHFRFWILSCKIWLLCSKSNIFLCESHSSLSTSLELIPNKKPQKCTFLQVLNTALKKKVTKAKAQKFDGSANIIEECAP